MQVQASRTLLACRTPARRCAVGAQSTAGGDDTTTSTSSSSSEPPAATIQFRGRTVTVTVGTRLRTALLESGLTPPRQRPRPDHQLPRAGDVRLLRGGDQVGLWSGGQRVDLEDRGMRCCPAAPTLFPRIPPNQTSSPKTPQRPRGPADLDRGRAAAPQLPAPLGGHRQPAAAPGVPGDARSETAAAAAASRMSSI
jgi:hypothetical protein